MRAPDRTAEHLPVRTALALLREIHRDGQRPLPELAALVGVSRPTAHRLLAGLDQLLGVRVEWSREGGYRVTRWGLLSRRRVVGKNDDRATGPRNVLT